MKKLCLLLLCAALAVSGFGPAALASEWSCEQCGAAGLQRNFCPDCGAARPSREWTCAQCGSVNERNFCPECGAARESSPPRVDFGLTREALRTPSGVYDYMDVCIRTVCEGYAPEWDMDAEALFGVSRLSDFEQMESVISYCNPDWSLEMYFIYPEGAAPDVDAPAARFAFAMRGGSELGADLSFPIGTSSVLALLYMLDPETDVEAARAMIERRENQSSYEGNGYRLTHIILDDTESHLAIDLI